MPYAPRNLLRAAAVGLGLLLTAAPAAADLILTAPPRETPEAGMSVYGPIAEHLTNVLGEPVHYQHPGNWPQYEARMKRDEFDIVFDGPHFAAWRIENLANQPVARLSGNLEFVLVVRTEDPVQQPRDLIGERVCTLPPPNLAGLTLYAMFANPAQQPEYVLTRQGGFQELHQAFMRNDCRAAMYRSAFFERGLPEAERAGLRVVQASSPLLNQGITVSARVNDGQRKRIAQSLTTPQGQAAVQALLARFAASDEKLVVADSTEYRNHNLLHDNLIFGW